MHFNLFFLGVNGTCNYLFAARAIAGDDGTAEQSPGKSEGESEASHRVPVSLAKIRSRARMNKTIDRSRFARVAHRVISYLGALSIAINMYISVTSDKISLARGLLRRLSFGASKGVL